MKITMKITRNNRGHLKTFLKNWNSYCQQVAYRTNKREIDSVGDPARIMRIPNTYNTKKGDNKLVKILEYNDKRYKLKDFGSILDKEFEAQQLLESLYVDHLMLEKFGKEF